MYARKSLNEYTRVYNQTIQSFPANFIAGTMNAKEIPYFNVINDEARNDAKISF